MPARATPRPLEPGGYCGWCDAYAQALQVARAGLEQAAQRTCYCAGGYRLCAPCIAKQTLAQLNPPATAGEQTSLLE
jgi:hypothetical protein